MRRLFFRPACICFPCNTTFLTKSEDNSSSGRWEAVPRVAISIFLLSGNFPKHLIDYVLLHELAHTREMNHGKRFWALLDRMTDGRAQGIENRTPEIQNGDIAVCLFYQRLKGISES